MLTRINYIRLFLFLFLFLHLVPFAFRESYQFLTILNYSIILFFLFLFSFNKKKLDLISIIFMGLILISTVMSLFGYSGTISSLILAASIPHFMFSNINSKKDFLELFYQPIIISVFLLILFSAQLYIDVKDDLTSYYFLGEYFITASINYVTLTLNCFCIITYLIIKTKIEQVDKKLFYSLFLVLLISLSVYFSIIFLTRTVFVCSLFILLAHLKKIRIYFILITLIIAINYADVIFLEVIKFFGAETLSDIASDNSRFDSVTNLINSQVNFEFDFRNQMSYSSLINLLFSLFPLTFMFLYSPFKALIIILKRRNISLLLVFSSSFIVVVYQMDFFSIFTFFFLINYVDKFLKNNTNVNKVN